LSNSFDGNVRVRYVILFSVVFLATMIAFAFVGNALFQPGDEGTSSQNEIAQPPESSPAPAAGNEPRDESTPPDPPPIFVRFVSTADDPAPEDGDEEAVANDEDAPSAAPSPSDLPVERPPQQVAPPAGAQQKDTTLQSRPQVQRRQNCRPVKRRFHRCPWRR
jgi:hypothetical protein